MPAKDPSRLLSVPKDMGSSSADQIRAIVEHNINSGRFQRVSDFHGKPLTIEEYTDNVTVYYALHHWFVASLKQGDGEAWDLQWKRLFRGAYTQLLRRGWDHEQAYMRAQEAAQETSIHIYNQIYTYDCPFDAWTAAILRNYISQTHQRTHDPHDRLGTTTSFAHATMQAVDDPADDARINRNNALRDALGKLRSKAQRQAIECLYFEGLSSQETAQKMGKTAQAIYNLKGQAFARLRELLNQHDID